MNWKKMMAVGLAAVSMMVFVTGKRKSAFVFPHGVAGQHHIGIVVPCHNQVMGIMCDARCNGSAFQAEVS